MPTVISETSNYENMKHTLTILILSIACTLSLPVVAQETASQEAKRQGRQAKWEQFRKDKHEFYTQNMELTEEQTPRFFELYDEMEKKKFEISREVRHELRRLAKQETPVTDAEYKAVADKAATLAEREAAIEKEYYEKICQILTPRQQYLYHRCAVDFQRKMLKKSKDGQKSECERK